MRIKAFQETTCYTKPFANKVTETYPIPPYATVKGLIHAVMDAKDLIPFSLSIQGDYESIIIDYRKTYFVQKREFNMPIILDGLDIDTPSFTSMSSMPLYTHMLYNVELVIHVQAEEYILQTMYHAFKNSDSHLSLGRHEDLLRIDEVKVMNIAELDLFEGAHLQHSMYIPTSIIEENEQSRGVPYLLNWTYQIKNGIREWHRIPTSFFTRGTLIDEDLIREQVHHDEDGYVVIWNI